MAYLREIEVKYKIRKIESAIIDHRVTGSHVIAALFHDLQNETKEKFLTVNLDGKNKILCFEVVAIGSIASIRLRPMEVFRTSILVNATGAVVVHNHPSGEVQPSQADEAFTQRLVYVADQLGLRLYDHVIIGVGGAYYSFADARHLVHDYSQEPP